VRGTGGDLPTQERKSRLHLHRLGELILFNATFGASTEAGEGAEAPSMPTGRCRSYGTAAAASSRIRCGLGENPEQTGGARTVRRIKQFLCCAAAAMGLIVASAPAAQAHYGDWWTQRKVTERECGSSCRYDYSSPYGEHSRIFFYTKFYGWDYCYREYYIGHNYHIFGQRTTHCSYWQQA